MKISFESKNVKLPEIDFDKVASWLMEVASLFEKKIVRLNYLFCDDEEILLTNNKFLGHDYYTDIITFDYCQGHRIGGDIIISLDTVKSNSEKFGVSYESELMRVIVHGLLHLCGVNDKGPGEREVMEEWENKALKLWSDQKGSTL